MKPDERIFGRGDFEVGVIRGADGPLHVRLPGADPDFADKTSSNLTVFLPSMKRVCGPPAGIGSSVTCHEPSAPALVAWLWPPILTVTSSPGSAQPQTRSF